MKKLSATKLIVYLFGIVLIGSLGSCMKDDNRDYPQSALTMVNGYVSANGVIYTSDNNVIQYGYNPLKYQGYEHFYNIFPGSRRIRIYTDNNQQLVDENYTFKDSTYYTSFIYGWQDDVQHLISEDKLLANLGEQTGIRFLHLSPSEDNVNVYLNDKENLLFGDRIYEGENEEEENEHILFTPQTSGKQTIIITDEEDETLVEREYTFEKGRHYSIILIGDSNSMARPLYIGVVPQY